MKANTGRSFDKYLREASESGLVQIGVPLPLGAYGQGHGVNFSIFSRNASRVRLELYDQPGDQVAARSIELDPVHNRTGDVWHVWVAGIRPGQLYGYRIDGPYSPEEGQRFNPNKLLLDPFATAIAGAESWDPISSLGYDPSSPQHDLSFSELDDAGSTPKSIFVHEHFDWDGDRLPQRPWSQTVIYETHVRGLTIHPSSGVAYPGTYRGLTEKIPYLKEMGVTAVELMPVQEFSSKGDTPLGNYWGYDPLSFTAPKASYCSSGGLGHQKLEFKAMVKALHQEKIEVILDVVFNHTVEGNELGPTVCFRGIDNKIFYMLEEDERFYRDYTGTGNTLNANHPVVHEFILDALRYWVLEMHVDGFRFDLASVLARDPSGNLLPNPPLIERIAEDPIVRNIKIIAEAWDVGGAYQVGTFSEHRWAEWNGRFRDDVRRFWRGDDGMIGLLASRISGSADLYEHSGRGPESSINYVTCHDGFTLSDLVSYKSKHNEANGEHNLDGMDSNYSDNYGFEGPTNDPAIEALRIRQIKNFLVTLFISRGVPMLLGGDEFRRTQQGNNNAYCQDNEISWYDWSLLQTHHDIARFTRGMIAFRRSHPVLSEEAFYTDADIRWYSSEGSPPNWGDPHERFLACLILVRGKPSLYLMFNAGRQVWPFILPDPPPGEHWCVAVDTSHSSPQDLYEAGQEVFLGDAKAYQVQSRSSVILVTAAR